MAKSSRFQHQYRNSASKLHKKVGDILRESDTFKNFTAYQEYPVSKINETYDNNAHRFDWVLPQLKVVIEVHGKQHFEACSFGMSAEQTVESFHDIKRRDNLKKDAALAAGWKYVMVPYTAIKDLDELKLYEYLQRGEQYESTIKKESKESNYQKEQWQKYKRSDGYAEQKKRSREYARKRYRELKEMKNASK